MISAIIKVYRLLSGIDIPIELYAQIVKGVGRKYTDQQPGGFQLGPGQFTPPFGVQVQSVQDLTVRT
jgi:hypothetical protein